MSLQLPFLRVANDSTETGGDDLEICVRIEEFTDPACPWAYSAEPFRLALNWLYEGRIEWTVRMVVLSDTSEENAEKGFTPEKLSESYRKIAREHGMPIDTGLRPRVHASRPACLAVVAIRTHRDEVATRALLRSLRIRCFDGELLDAPETVDGAARDAGIEPAELRGWMDSDDVGGALEADMAAARRPMPAARILDHKLANWSGGRRYTCPSYEISRIKREVTISVPGFQPFAAYDTILANLVPGLERREPPSSVEELLLWARTPLATKEVAVVCDIEVDEARQELGHVATERHLGADGFWSLA